MAHRGGMKGRVETGPRVQNEAKSSGADSPVTVALERGLVGPEALGRRNEANRGRGLEAGGARRGGPAVRNEANRPSSIWR